MHRPAPEPGSDGPPRHDRDGGPEAAFAPVVEALTHLAQFHMEQGNNEAAAEALERRVDLLMKVAELHGLIEHVSPAAAMAEFYRFTDRPDRAAQIERQAQAQEIAELERRLSELRARQHMLELERERLEGMLHRSQDRRVPADRSRAHRGDGDRDI